MDLKSLHIIFLLINKLPHLVDTFLLKYGYQNDFLKDYPVESLREIQTNEGN